MPDRLAVRHFSTTHRAGRNGETFEQSKSVIVIGKWRFTKDGARSSGGRKQSTRVDLCNEWDQSEEKAFRGRAAIHAVEYFSR